MSFELPGHIEELVAAGLDTGDPSDRLLALGVANEADARYDTRFGLEVVEIFLAQTGMRFAPATQDIKQVSYGDLVPAERARVIREVSKAVDDTLGVHSRFFEFLAKGSDKDPEDRVVFYDDEDEGESVVGLIKRPLSKEYPFMVKQRYATDASQQNFEMAVKAVEGKTFKGVHLDRSWLGGTLSRIWNLEEVQPER